MKRTNLTLMVFALMNFVVGMTTFVFNGILDRVAVSLNVSIAQSGLLTTMYSYGAAFGPPIALLVFRKSERSKMLKTMLFVTILTTLALVYAQSFGQLLVTRALMGVSANTYSVLAISTIVALSTKRRQGRSMAFYIAGASIAQMIGIPLTRALLPILDWRSTFWMLNIIMMFALVYFKIYLPKGGREPEEADLGDELRFLRDGKALSVVVYTLIVFVGYGAFHTYITPYLVLLFPSIGPLGASFWFSWELPLS